MSPLPPFTAQRPEEVKVYSPLGSCKWLLLAAATSRYRMSLLSTEELRKQCNIRACSLKYKIQGTEYVGILLLKRSKRWNCHSMFIGYLCGVYPVARTTVHFSVHHTDPLKNYSWFPGTRMRYGFFLTVFSSLSKVLGWLCLLHSVSQCVA